MTEYTSDKITKQLRQYDMLSKSLKLINDSEQRSDICSQMTLIIDNVLEITNQIYEEKFYKILNKKTELMDEEINKLQELISLINDRREYVDNQINENQLLTGMSCNNIEIFGEDKLEHYKNQVRIIEKYKINIKMDAELKEEILTLDINIKKAKEKIANNKILNRQLEEKMKKLLEKSFKELKLYELKERKEEIDLAYTELGYSLEKAKENASIARRDCSEDIIMECDNMLASITLDYERYKEKKLILKLLDIYNKICPDYDSILKKREEINNILTEITSGQLYKYVGAELEKEYSTIKLEQQDIATLNSLLEERQNKNNTLAEIIQENESKEFKETLAGLLENEKLHQEELKKEEEKKEEELKIKRKEEEKKKKEEFFRRQRLIEEERKKEIEQRTKDMLFEKKNSVLQADKVELVEQQKKFNQKNSNSEISRKLKAKEIENIFAPNKPKINIQEDKKEEEKKEITKEDTTKEIIKEEPKKEKTPETRNKEIEIKNKELKEDIFPKKIVKEESKDDFLEFPDKNDESFFDDEEFDSLNKFMEDDNKNWF